MEEPKKAILKEVTFKGTITLEDKEVREWLEIISRKVDRINERTKKHTREIQELEKK